MVKAIIFDADGMIIRGEKFSDRLSREYNVPLEKISKLFERDYGLCATGKADLKEVLGNYLQDWGWSGGVEDILAVWFRVDSLDLRLVAAIKDLRQKGIRCYLATNQEKYRLEYLIKEFRLDQLFDGLFPSCQIGFKKPAREFFEFMVGKLPGVEKSEVLYWDDREENVAAAREFGFPAEVYRGFEDFSDKLRLVTGLK